MKISHGMIIAIDTHFKIFRDFIRISKDSTGSRPGGIIRRIDGREEADGYRRTRDDRKIDELHFHGELAKIIDVGRSLYSIKGRCIAYTPNHSDCCPDNSDYKDPDIK